MICIRASQPLNIVLGSTLYELSVTYSVFTLSTRISLQQSPIIYVAKMFRMFKRYVLHVTWVCSTCYLDMFYMLLGYVLHVTWTCSACYLDMFYMLLGYVLHVTLKCSLHVSHVQHVPNSSSGGKCVTRPGISCVK